jgi:cytochrome c553
MKARIRWMRLALASVIVFACFGIGAFLFAWSGAYSVAASRGHWTIFEYFLAFVMRNSVERRAALIDPPPLDDVDLITLGAGAYHSGCAWCHGAPGTPTNPVTRRMLPTPPDLSARMRDWEDEELFWIVQHGIKYTGMPAWTSQKRQDEVWAVVAFLRGIESLDADSYRELALGPARTPEGGREIAFEEDAVEAAVACARCHGAEGSGPRSALVPILHGQPAESLIAALQAYQAGKRESGIMQPLANDLTQGDVEHVARYYASLALPALSSAALTGANLSNGRKLAEEGLPEAELPACVSCHGEEALPIYPRLAGQSARYIANQLQLWKRETTRHSNTAVIMAPIARALTDQQITDVAAYLASRPQTGTPR